MRNIGSIPGPNGPIVFSMEGDRFLIGSVNRQVAVEDDEFTEVNGHLYADITFLKLGEDFQDIIIPDHVLELKTQIRKENALSKNCVTVIEHEKGKIYISISADCKIICKLDEKTSITNKLYVIEGKKALYVPEFGLNAPFLEVPELVESELKAAKKAIEMRELRLVYAGKSLLTGKDYFKLSCDVNSQTWYRVRECFEYFGDNKGTGGVYGWCTSKPELVEEYLRMRNKISDRTDEIEKQKIQAEKAQKKAIESILKVQ